MARILVIDDRAVNRELIEACLKPYGHELTFCADPKSALQAAAKQRPDLIISDLHMKPNSGIALCRTCKQDLSLKNTPFLLFSASDPTRAEMREAAGAGAECCVSRPIQPRELIALVHHYVKPSAPRS